MVQAQLALLRFGVLDDVQAAMQADDMPREAKIYWEKAQVVRREDETVAMCQSLLKLTNTQIDELFTLAATL
jgi:hypothetical protein